MIHWHLFWQLKGTPIFDLSEKAALNYVRDVLATWFYLMVERYGKTTRKKLLEDFVSPAEMWEESLIARVKTAARYDKNIELCADYRPKDIARPEQVWKRISNGGFNLSFKRESRLFGV